MKKQYIYWMMFIPLFCGVMVFYIVPFLYSFYYSVIDNMTEKNFTGFDNYINLLKNDLFMSASWLTIIFMIISIPLSMIIALVIAICLNKTRKFRIFFPLKNM